MDPLLIIWGFNMFNEIKYLQALSQLMADYISSHPRLDEYEAFLILFIARCRSSINTMRVFYDNQSSQNY